MITKEDIKQLIKEVIQEARIYNRSAGMPTSTEYTLTQEEERVNIARHGFETVQKFNRTNFAKRIIETTNKGVIYDQAIPKHRQKAA